MIRRLNNFRAGPALGSRTHPLKPAISRNYTAHDFSDLMKDIGAPSGPQLLDMVKDIPLFDDDLGVDVHCMHGFNNTTPLQFQ